MCVDKFSPFGFYVGLACFSPLLSCAVSLGYSIVVFYLHMCAYLCICTTFCFYIFFSSSSFYFDVRTYLRTHVWVIAATTCLPIYRTQQENDEKTTSTTTTTNTWIEWNSYYSWIFSISCAFTLAHWYSIVWIARFSFISLVFFSTTCCCCCYLRHIQTVECRFTVMHRHCLAMKTFLFNGQIIRSV